MKKRILTVILGMLCAVGMNGQSEPTLPQLATPSPKATMIDRFGYYPTNLYTGLVDITIPIHTIEVKGIKIPIEFKYHASGLKYDDLPMELGYGWTLMAGGTVSYSARGTGLFPPNGTQLSPFIKQVSDITLNDKTGNPDSDQLQLDYVFNGSKSKYDHVDYYRDSEYDVYNYSFLGHNGQYYSLSDGSCFMVPSTTISMDAGYHPIAKDENGNKYMFEISDTDTYDRNYTHYLTKIITADGADVINFVYEKVLLGSEDKVKRPIINNYYVIKFNRNMNAVQTEYGGGIDYKDFNTPILKEINYKGGKVKFIYSSTSKRSLEKIEIRDQEDNLIKIITLAKTNDAYLDAVTFCDKNSTDIYSYRFEYNGTKLEDRHAIVDYWGYYTGSISSSGLYIPKFTTSILGIKHVIPGMDRTPNEYGMQKGILKKVVYPTKGYSTFTYEGHRSGNKLYGGLRIKEIKNYDAKNNLLESKWYVYGSKEDGNGRAIQQVDVHDYFRSTIAIEGYASSTFTPRINNHILYQTYTAFPIRSYYSMGSTVVYPHVVEYIGTPTEISRRTEYNYTDNADEYEGTIKGNMSELPTWSNAWQNGKLFNKTVKNAAGETVYSLHNIYEEINRKDYLNLRVLPYAQIYINGGTSEVVRYFTNYPEFASAIDGSLYDYYNYYITAGDYAITESHEYVDGAAKITKYKYNQYGQVIEQTQTDPEDNLLVTKYKYAAEVQKDTPSGDVYHAMYRCNMLGPIIEKEVYKGTALVDKTINGYKDWGNGLIALQDVSKLNYYEPRIKYHGYDKYGNPTGISKANNTEKTHYIWGHKGQRVIAEMRGGSFSSLDQALIDRVTSATSPSSADMAVIEGLRSNPSLAGCRLTTYYYDSALNLTRLVMPNGTQTSYEYDAFSRLSSVKDADGKVIEAYQYDYKQ